MDVLPDIKPMVDIHPHGKGLGDRIGGPFKSFIKGKETCASAVCYSLNRRGAKIENLKLYSSPWIGGDHHPHAVAGGDGFLYITSVADMIVYLNGRYGEAQKFPDKTAHQQLQGTTGIIAFGFRHIDFWYRHDDGEFTSHHYICFGDPSTVKRGVFFWEREPDFPLFND